MSSSAEKSNKFLSSSFDNERDFKAYKSQLSGWSNATENISPSSLPAAANLAMSTGKSPKRNSPQKLHSDTDILSSSPGNSTDPLRRRFSSSLNANNGAPNVTSFNNSIVVAKSPPKPSNASQSNAQSAPPKPNDKQKLSKSERKAMYEKSAQQAQQKRKEGGQHIPNDQPQKQEKQEKQQKQQKQPSQSQQQKQQQPQQPGQQEKQPKQQQEKPAKQEKPQDKAQPQNAPTKQTSAPGKLTTSMSSNTHQFTL